MRARKRTLFAIALTVATLILLELSSLVVWRLLKSAGRELVAEGVDFLDLTRLFHDDQSTLYADACCHLNDRGYERLAAAIGAHAAARLHHEPRVGSP